MDFSKHINHIRELNIYKVPMNEASLNRILDHHYDHGFIIISSYRSSRPSKIDGSIERTDKENKQTFTELKNDVRNAGYSFIPVYGGYIENYKQPNEVEVTEPALIIPNKKIGTSDWGVEDFDQLIELGKTLCAKFNQDDFLVKLPDSGDNAFYMDRNGVTKLKFIGKTLNDLTQEYFTDLIDGRDKNKSNKRITFTENIFINENPRSVSEAHARYGELFFS